MALEKIKNLINEKADINGLGPRKPLHKVCLKDSVKLDKDSVKLDKDSVRLDIIKNLIEKKADINLQGDNGAALHSACMNPNISLEALKYLVNNGANVDTTLSSVGTPFDYSCMYGSKDNIKYLFEKATDKQSYMKYSLMYPEDLSTNHGISKFISVFFGDFFAKNHNDIVNTLLTIIPITLNKMS